MVTSLLIKQITCSLNTLYDKQLVVTCQFTNTISW